MIMKTPRLFACLLFVLFSLLSILAHSGCTAAGFGIGAAIDARQPKKEMTIQGWEVVKLRKNARITVYRKDHEPLTGNYLGVTKMNPQTDTANNTLLVGKKGDYSTRYQIPFGNIEQIHVPGRKATGRIVGPIIGFVLDVGFVVLAANSLEFNFGFDPYCPYVYSFDGTAYQLDAEMCSNAFYRAAQREDWAALEHLRAVHGVYKIKLANELQESDYVDQLSLLVFDHPAGARIYPSAAGDYYALKHLQAARYVQGPSGSDITALLADQDDMCWLSNPFDRDPENNTALRDTVELIFDKPEHAASAALLLHLRNTPWASAQHRMLLALQGPAWYGELNSDAHARDVLTQALERENGLHFSVWNGEKWQPAGLVNVVGPAVDRAVVQEVELNGIPGKSLRIRLDCPPGYWIVNSARLDYSYARATAAHELFPNRATDQNGQEVNSLLGQTDGAYFSMPKAGDYAELEFDAPKAQPGTERTVMVRCNGYYTPHIQSGGKPQKALMNKLLSEPGAYNGWRLHTLNRDLKN